MSHFPDITYAHPNYPELLTDKNLKGHWLKWIKSAQRAQHRSERVRGKMREQLKILRSELERFNFPNYAEIPVFGVNKKMIDRNLEEKSKESGIKPNQINAKKFVKKQQPAGQRTHEAQNSKTKTVQAVADIPAEQKKVDTVTKGDGNLEDIFDKMTQEDIDEWNKEGRRGGRKKSKKRKRRKTKRKRKSKKSRTRKRKKRRKSKKRKSRGRK